MRKSEPRKNTAVIVHDGLPPMHEPRIVDGDDVACLPRHRDFMPDVMGLQFANDPARHDLPVLERRVERDAKRMRHPAESLRKAIEHRDKEIEER